MLSVYFPLKWKIKEIPIKQTPFKKILLTKAIFE